MASLWEDGLPWEVPTRQSRQGGIRQDGRRAPRQEEGGAAQRQAGVLGDALVLGEECALARNPAAAPRWEVGGAVSPSVKVFRAVRTIVLLLVHLSRQGHWLRLGM